MTNITIIIFDTCADQREYWQEQKFSNHRRKKKPEVLRFSLTKQLEEKAYELYKAVDVVHNKRRRQTQSK